MQTYLYRIIKVRYALIGLILLLFLLLVTSCARSGTVASIYQGITKGDTTFVAQLLQANPSLANKPDELGGTPLHYAVAHGRMEIVKLLVNTYRVNVNVRTVHGTAPLHQAVLANDITLAKFLLKHGADVNPVDVMGVTPFCIAREKNFMSMLHLLFRYGGACDSVPTYQGEQKEYI